MSKFIQLGHAARMLAGEHPEDCGLWLSVLESEADALAVVRLWTDYKNDTIPGGVSYWRPTDQWQIPLHNFSNWCRTNGHPAPYGDEDSKDPVSDESVEKPALGRRGKQIAVILNAIKENGWDALSVPFGGKQALKVACLGNSLFTESSFDHAWKAAVCGGYVRAANHEIASKRY